MERYAFDELKNLAIDDVFVIQPGIEYRVDSAPVHYADDVFYGDYSEKVEFTAICISDVDEKNRQIKFVIQKAHLENEDAGTTQIFKKV